MLSIGDVLIFKIFVIVIILISERVDKVNGIGKATALWGLSRHVYCTYLPPEALTLSPQT